MEEVSFLEENSEYHFDGIINNQIEKADFSITDKENFRQNTLENIKKFFSRENILKFGLMIGEAPIPIESTSGQTMIATIDSTQIRKRINTFPEKDRKKIGYIHISTVQILLKSTFLKGIDTPIELVLEDSRINNPELAKIAEGSCNLKYGKVKFDVNLQFGLSLKDADLNRSINLTYKMKDPHFMKKGNHPFTICYKINYALSNSHHSVEFKGKDRIHIDELFAPLVNLKTPFLGNKINRTSSLIQSTRYPRIESGESSKSIKPPRRDFEVSEEKEVEKLQLAIKNLSNQVSKIDSRI